MSIANPYRLWCAEYHPVGAASSVQIAGMTNTGLPANTQILSESTGESLFPLVASVQGLRPVLNFTTLNLTQAINAIGLGGKCITSDGTHPGLTLYYAKWGCAGPASGSVHLKLVIGNGVIAPRSLTVDHQGNAQLAYEVNVRYDGTNAPIVATNNVALPVLSANAARWTMAAAAVNSVAVTGKKSIGIQWSPQITQEGSDSEIYDSAVSIDSLPSIITFSGINPQWFAGAVGTQISPIGGAAVDGATSYFTLRKRNTADATAEHIKISFDGLVYFQDIINAAAQGLASSSFAITCAKAAGTNPIVADTAFALA